MEYIIIVVILLIILLAILRSNNKNIHLEMNKLIDALGGYDNIIETELNLSRFIVTLKDVTKVDKVAIQKMGAKGIVEIDNQLKIVLDREAKQLKKYISEIK